MEVIASKFNGFCNGVLRSISLLESEMDTGTPIFISSELVHNNIVTNKYQKKNIHFLSEILNENADIKNESIPLTKKSTLVLAAHGIPYYKLDKYRNNFNKIIDGTCPIVKVRQEQIRNTLENTSDEILLFVKNTSHSEVLTLCDNYKTDRLHIIELNTPTNKLLSLDKDKLYRIHTQTTFPSSELQKYLEFLTLQNFEFSLESSICPSCKERQEECNALCLKCTNIIVVGSSHSSNANELKRIAKDNGIQSYLVEKKEDLNTIELDSGEICGVISSASSSSETFASILNALSKK